MGVRYGQTRSVGQSINQSIDQLARHYTCLMAVEQVWELLVVISRDGYKNCVQNSKISMRMSVQISKNSIRKSVNIYCLTRCEICT